MKKFSFYVLCFFVSVQLQSQNKYSKSLDNIKTSYDQNKLTSLVSEFTQRQTRLKKEAETYARINNIPMRYETEDGILTELQYITEEGAPIYYTTFNVDAAISTRTNFLNTGGGLGLALNGDDLTAHVWDAGLARDTHQEYDGAGGVNRFSVGDESTTLNSHAAHVTGTVMASGVVAEAKGMAWQADAVGYDWSNDVSEAASASAEAMLLSNHSYGYRLRDSDGNALLSPLELGGYITNSRNWDDIMYYAPYYLMVVAAGNDGYDDTSNTDPLDGATAFDKLSGHATSKNNLVVANANDAVIDVDGTLQSVSKNGSSSEGPTDDYRIKPDITGNGTGLFSTYDSADDSYNSITGTSMASPNVTGSLLLLQEHYHNLHGTFMHAATLKGLALHTADDAGDAGPDANFGWGLLNTKKAAETLTIAAATSGSTIVKELTLNQGDTYQLIVQSNGVDPLLASISWTDIGGTVQTVVNDNTSRLVNDLDVRLTNDTVYTPWKLTAADSNGKGDNTVDPYERIDIDGASGFYTLTVSHKESLNTGSQNFSLIVSGVVVATTPVISYSTTSSSLIESSDCSATLVTFPLIIAQAPSANATVNFTVNESSTAINGLDFEIVTPSIIFPSGVTNSINLELNIYNDGFIEGDETIIIDFNVVNDAGGDASADLNDNKLTLTLMDDDIVPTESQTVSIYSEDMEEAPYGITTNNSGNGSSAWGLNNATAASSEYWNTTGNSTIFAYTNDDACNCDKSDDLLTTEEFSLDGLYSSATLTFDHAFSNIGPEIGDVLVSTGGAFSSVLPLSNTSAGGSVKTTPWVNDVTVDMTPYIGEAVVLVQFRYNDGAIWSYGMAVDNISITAVTPTLVQTAVNKEITNDQQPIAGAGTIYTSDSLTGDVMLDITNNNQADDYGCIEVSVSRSGTAAQPYNGSSNPFLVMDKTFEISSSNTIELGSTSINFYFTEQEISGWESATSNTRNNLVIGRVIDGVITESSLATIGSFAENVTLSGGFSDVKGTYVFGNTLLPEPTITFNNIDSSYGDADFNLEATSNSTGTISYTIVGENSTGTSLSGTNNEILNVGNVGSVIIRATQEADDSFSSATQDITLTINRRAITLTANEQEKIYGDQLALDDTVFTTLDKDGDAVLPNGEVVTNVTINSATGVDASTTSDVATYADEIVISGPVAGTDGTGDGFLESNYDITYVAGDLTVNRRAAQIIPSAQEKDYGDVHNLDDTAFTVVDRDGGALPNGETVNTVTLVSANVVDASADANAVLYADNISVTPTSTNDPTIAGSANFNQENYIFSYGTGDLTVNRRAAQIIASAQEKDYGDVHDLGDIAFTVVDRDGGALPNGETVNAVTLVSADGIDASTDANAVLYADNISVTPTSTNDPTIAGSANFNQENYTFSYGTGDLSITAAPLTITADSDTKVYGAIDPALTYTITGFVNSDAESDLDTGVTISRVAGETVADYIITPSEAVDSNYVITFVPSTFEITQANLTVTATSGLSKVYGEIDPTLTYSITGFVNSDAEASLDTGVTISRVAGETVADYIITPSAAADSNYAVSFVPSTFTITPATLTVTGLVVDNKEYDGTTEATTSGTPVLSGVISNDNMVLDASPVFTFESPGVGTNITITNAGFTIAGTNNVNYTLTQPILSADITQRAITLTASSQEKNYGNMLVLDDTAFTVTDLDNDAVLPNGEMIDSVTMVSETGIDVDITAAVGTYVDEITISQPLTGYNGFDESNYSISYVSGDLTVISSLNINDPERDNLVIFISKRDKLHVFGVENSTAAKVQLFGISGKEIFTTSFVGQGTNEIHLPNLSDGIYIVKLITLNGITNKKIIIN